MDRQHPKISVVMPAHNSERYLAEAVESVLGQTFRALELLIIENASTDRTLEIAQEYARLDSRVHVLQSDIPSASAAMNLGVEHSRAEWIARMDSDDIWLPEKLERQWQFIQRNPDIDVVGTWGWHIGASGKRMGMFRVGPTSREHFQRLREENEVIYLLSPSAMFSRKSAEATGGHDVGFVVAQDVEYWTRLADQFSVLTLPEPLVLYRVHATAASTRLMSRQKIAAELIQQNAGLRRSGLPELTYEQFVALRSDRPRLTRLKETFSWQSQTFYRRGGAELAADKFQGYGWLALSAVLDPHLVWRRLRMQRVLSTIRSR